MVVVPVRYTASFFASMKKERGFTAGYAQLVMMRGGGNMPEMRSVISSAIILDLEPNVTAGQYSFLFMNT